MIIVIKTKNKNQLIIKTLSLVSLVIMFWVYYQYMSNKFQEENQKLSTKLEQTIIKKEINKSISIEKTIYKESVIIVNLLNQKHIQSIKIVKDKLFIVCDFNTNIEPLLIRYGVAAMIKHSRENIKIAIDLKNIVENKYDS